MMKKIGLELSSVAIDVDQTMDSASSGMDSQTPIKDQDVPGKIKTRRILIVEDNELSMKLIRHLVQARGHEAVEVTDGMEALQTIRQTMPDLVLMDILLPGKSGLDVAQAMKDDDLLKHIPIVAVTAFAMTGDEERILAGGCDAYVSKPISQSVFYATMERFL